MGVHVTAVHEQYALMPPGLFFNDVMCTEVMYSTSAVCVPRTRVYVIANCCKLQPRLQHPGISDSTAVEWNHKDIHW